ncbi:MAG: hypothetical protein R2762_07415 [Bryobacteraceae bacterium]
MGTKSLRLGAGPLMIEPTLRDTDDGERDAIDDDAAVQHGRVRPELRGPVRVTEDGYRMSPAIDVVGGS